MEEKRTVIYSAYKLDTEEIDMIAKKFTFIDKSNIENFVDRSIYAGVIIYYQDKIIDLSLKRGLNKLSKKLYEVNK